MKKIKLYLNNILDMSHFYNNSFDNLSNFAEIDNSSTLMNTILQTDITKEKKTKSLTHRECVLLYLNPDIGSETKYNLAVDHIKTCKTCKNELGKNSIPKEQKQVKIIEPSQISHPIIQTTPSPIIEPEYKKMMQDEKNIIHQNLLIENTISKYFDTIEEKKKMGDNIEKILTQLNAQNFNIFMITACLVVLILLVILDIFIMRRNSA